MRKVTSVDNRLSLALRFLATGYNFSDLEADFKIHRTTISGIVTEVCEAIYDCFKDEYLKIPKTKKDWKCTAEKIKKNGSFLTASEQRTGNIYPFYSLKILGHIFAFTKVPSAL